MRTLLRSVRTALLTSRRRRIALAAGVLGLAALATAIVLTVGMLAQVPASVAAPASAAPAAPTPSAPPVTAAPVDSPAPSAAPAAPPAATVSTTSSTIATASGGQVAIRSAAGGAVVGSLANPQASGAPLTFLVLRTQGAWLEVDLPQRPNGSTGWISAADVTLSTDPFALVASTAGNTLALYRDGRLQQTFPVATGTGGTPTPTGAFYLTELLAPTNAGYGPYAFGLSAFSDVLTSFGGGPGQIGLHGTPDAASVGHAASHGCLRLGNADITTLARMLPLGTPITIL